MLPYTRCSKKQVVYPIDPLGKGNSRVRSSSPPLYIFVPALLHYRKAAPPPEVQLPSVRRLCTCKRIVHTDQRLITLSCYLGLALGVFLGFVRGLVPRFFPVQYLFYLTNHSGQALQPLCTVPVIQHEGRISRAVLR